MLIVTKMCPVLFRLDSKVGEGKPKIPDSHISENNALYQKWGKTAIEKRFTFPANTLSVVYVRIKLQFDYFKSSLSMAETGVCGPS